MLKLFKLIVILQLCQNNLSKKERGEKEIFQNCEQNISSYQIDCMIYSTKEFGSIRDDDQGDLIIQRSFNVLTRL